MQPQSPTGLLPVAMVAVTLAALAAGLGTAVNALLLAVVGVPEYGTLAAALALVSVALAAEWGDIARRTRAVRMGPASAGCSEPRPPSIAEVAATLILTAATGVLLAVLAEKAYALAFAPGSSTAETNSTLDIAVFDADGDGDLDYVAGNAGAPADVYTNDGAGSFSRTSTLDFPDSTFENLDVGDMDRDGDIDVVLIDSQVSSSVLEVYKNDGAGSFTGNGNEGAGALGRDVHLLDMDADGDLDVITCANAAEENAVFANDGAGNLTQVASTLPECERVRSADFDGDGHLDLALVQNAGALRIYRNSGTGAFTPLWSDNGPFSYDLAPGDINGDGEIDIVVLLGSVGARPFLNDGGGASFSAGADFGAVVDTSSLALGDVDNDGDLDVIIGAMDSISGVNGGNEVWLNDGGGVFTQSGTPTEEDDCTRDVALGDLDGDGDLDYVAANEGSCGPQPNRHYLSDQSATLPNAAPSPPSGGFSATATGGMSVLTAGPLGPGTGSNGIGTGTVAWLSPDDIVSNDGASASVGLNQGEVSQYLTASGFGFAIPANTSIRGIRVEWALRRLAGEPRDAEVRLVKGGTAGAADRSTNSIWPGVETYVAYGAPGDLWGETWTAADINDPGFGTVFAARQTAAGLGGGEVDHVRVTVYYSDSVNLTLRWGSGSDAITPARQLQYQVRVGTTAGGRDVISEKAGSPQYADRLMPSGQSRRRLIRGLPCGATYTWAVAAVDGGLRVGSFSAEQTTTIDEDCQVDAAGGGSSAPGGVGGGRGWWLFTTESPGGSDGHMHHGTILGQAFVDWNGNGKREKSERGGFGGLTVQARGYDQPGDSAPTASATVRGDGAFTLSVPPGRYRLSVSDDIGVLAGFSPTTSAAEITVAASRSTEAALGWRESRMPAYKPCLRIGNPDAAASRTPSETLLDALTDRYGRKVDIPHGGVLVTRREFVMLLARTQCLEGETDSPSLRERLREQARAAGRKDALLRDLPLLAGAGSDEWTRTAYALLAGGMPVARLTNGRLMMDAQAPVTRREAMGMVAAALHARQPAETAEYPPDATEADRAAGTFAALKALDVLPRGFERTMNAGLTWPEAAELLVRSAFVGGKIPLGAAPDEGRWNQAAVPDYLEAAGTISRRACVVQDASRAEAVGTGASPGSRLHLEDRLRFLLTVGTPARDGRIRWLITGQPADYGVKAGVVRVAAETPVTRIALLHALVVATCHPLEASGDAEVRLAGGGADVGDGGTGERIFSPDRYAGTPDTAEFASRVLHSAQRPIREYNLSLFSFSPDLQRGGQQRAAHGAASLDEASGILASAALYTRVKVGAMTRLEAEAEFVLLRSAILRRFTGVPAGDVWRLGGAGGNEALTWGDLIVFLSDVLGPELADAPLPAKADGEAWWAAIELR